MKPQQVMLICVFVPKGESWIVKGDSWRIGEKGIKAQKDSLRGYLSITKDVKSVPKQINETVFNDIRETASYYCLAALSKDNMCYTVVVDKKTKKTYGVGYAVRQTPIGTSEARRHDGVVLRCARCGEAPPFAMKSLSSFSQIYHSKNDRIFQLMLAGIMDANVSFDKSARYFLCEKCRVAIGASLRMTSNSIATCWCGYRFLDGWAEWYFQHKDNAKCPNCGITMARSGAVIVGIGTLRSL